VEAAQRYLDFMLGWFAEPLRHGKYPRSMRQNVGERLPEFTSEEKALLKDSIDFFGVNHYTTTYVGAPNHPKPNGSNPGWQEDMNVHLTRSRNGTRIGPMAASDWLYVVPWGLGKLLPYLHTRYNKSIWITENGVDVPGEDKMTIEQAQKDKFRINYLNTYLDSVAGALLAGVPIEGYTVWSLLDNFEWAAGYSMRFGIYYVDYAHEQTRYEKDSAKWLRKFIQANRQPLYGGFSLVFWIVLGILVVILIPPVIFLVVAVFRRAKQGGSALEIDDKDGRGAYSTVKGTGDDEEM